MNNTNLKIIAIVTMLIDHMGAVLFPDVFFLRMIGRLAFPIFAFLLVEGYFHTRNIDKYIIRLGLFALISEIPFDLAFFETPFYFGYQNIFFTLFLGLISMKIIDTLRHTRPLLGWIIFFVLCTISVFLRTDYDILGMMTILFFFMYRDEPKRALFSVGSLHLIYGLIGAGVFSGQFDMSGFTQALAACSMFLLWKYNGEKGLALKYVFYAFYPVHLLVLAGASWLMT